MDTPSPSAVTSTSSICCPAATALAIADATAVFVETTRPARPLLPATSQHRDADASAATPAVRIDEPAVGGFDSVSPAGGANGVSV